MRRWGEKLQAPELHEEGAGVPDLPSLNQQWPLQDGLEACKNWWRGNRGQCAFPQEFPSWDALGPSLREIMYVKGLVSPRRLLNPYAEKMGRADEDSRSCGFDAGLRRTEAASPRGRGQQQAS